MSLLSLIFLLVGGFHISFSTSAGSSDSLTVAPLPTSYTTGIVQKTDDSVYFPRRSFNFNFEFDWQKWDSILTDFISSVAKVLKKPAAEAEPYTKLTAFVGERISFFQNAYGIIKKFFQSFSSRSDLIEPVFVSTTASSVPTVTPSTVWYSTQNAAIIPLNEWINEVPSFEDFLKNSSVDASSDLTALLDKVINYFSFADQLLDDLRSVLNAVRDHQAPLLILDVNKLKDTLTAVRQNISDILLTADEDLQRVTSGKFTFARNIGFKLRICLVYFPLTKVSKFDLIHADTFPVWDGSSWVEFQLTKDFFLSSSNARWPFASNSDLYHCPDSIDTYTICFFHEIPSGPLDACSVAVVQHDTNGLKLNCKFTKSHSVPSKTLQISARQWVYALSNSNGKVIEYCPLVHSKSFLLPPNGLLNFRSGCKYEFVNGPFSASMLPFTTDFEIVVMPSTNMFPELSVPVQPVLDHLHLNYLIYVSVLSVVCTLLVVFLVCTTCFVRHRRPRSRSVESPEFNYPYHPARTERSSSRIPLALEYPQY